MLEGVLPTAEGVLPTAVVHHTDTTMLRGGLDSELPLPASRSSDGRRPSSGAAPPAGALETDPPPAPAAAGGAKRECCAVEWSAAVNIVQVAMFHGGGLLAPDRGRISTLTVGPLHRRHKRRSDHAEPDQPDPPVRGRENCTWATHMSYCVILSLLRGFPCSPQRKNGSPQKRVSL